MEVLGRPRVDEQGRRFCYKRCKVCGFALRHFLDSVGTVLTPSTTEPKVRRPSPAKTRPPVLPVLPVLPALPAHPVHPTARGPVVGGRKPAPSRHGPHEVARSTPHRVEAGRKSGARRRR